MTTTARTAQATTTGRAGRRWPSLRALARVARWAFLGVGLLMATAAAWVIVTVWPAASEPASEKRPLSAFFYDSPRVLNIAHRGASAHAPEHTWAAYELALAQGADVLELDVRTTRDGSLVVSHDRSLRRTLGIDLEIATASYAELRAAAGSRTPLLLSEVLSRHPSARLNLELKDDDVSVAVALAELLREHAAESRVLVASGRGPMLEAFRQASQGKVATSAGPREAARCLMAYWLERSCSGPFVALQLPAGLSLPGLRTASFHRFLHAQGLVVHYFTVDRPEAQRALLKAGADGIMTNQPDRLARVLHAVDGHIAGEPAR